MEKRLLKSDEEYFEMCVGESIGDIKRQYASQYSDIGENSDSVECDFKYKYEFGIYKDNPKTLHIKHKPKSYPCVFVWHRVEGDHDFLIGEFVYPSDF